MTLTNEQKDKIREDFIENLRLGKLNTDKTNYMVSDELVANYWLNIIEEQLERQRLEVIGEIEKLDTWLDAYDNWTYNKDEILALPSLNPKNE